MVTNGFGAVYIVNAVELIAEAESILRNRLPYISEDQLVRYLHIAIIRGIEEAGIGQTSTVKHYLHVGDRHWSAINFAAKTIYPLLWQMFQRLNITSWIWFDKLKVVGKRELWLCWTH